MSERPPILSHGRIENIREEGRLFDVRMPNGYLAIAVLPKGGPSCPERVIGTKVEVAFFPYDMSRCKVVRWQVD